MTCNATEALLRVAYNITQDAWDSSRSYLSNRYQFAPFLHLVTREDRVRYESFLSLTDYEACVPRGECSEIAVGGLPTDGYTILFDGEAVDIGHEFIFDGVNPVTSTEVGICNEVPVCNDTDALLEFQYWGGGNSAQIFQVKDKDFNTVLDGEMIGDRGLGNGTTVTKTYACLPKEDACYTFLIGGEYRWPLRVNPAASYSVIYDGELVRRSDSWQFDSVRFGDGCELPCSPGEGSNIEFFMFDRSVYDYEVNYEYEWSLSFSGGKVSSVVPMGPGISPLAYMSMCISKDNCASFNIVAPNVTREVTRFVEEEGNFTNVDDIKWVNVTVNETIPLLPVYSLIMDNVTYRSVRWMPDSWTTPELDQTTNMGSCNVAGLCDEETQDLFQLDLRTKATNDYTVPPFPTVSLPMIESYDIRWNFGFTTPSADRKIALWDQRYLLRDGYYITDAYDLDTKYGVIECVPKHGCDLSFNMTPSSPVESYTVQKNGIQLNDTQEVGPEFYEALMTPFGQNCSPPSNSLSGGAIAGIVIGCLVVVGAVVFGSVWYKKRQNQNQSAETEDGGEEPPKAEEGGGEEEP